MQCFLCSAAFPEFVPADLEPTVLLCPKCGSRPEHRHQGILLARALKFTPADKILSVGASEPELRYLAAQARPAKLTAIDLRDRSFHAVLQAPQRAMQMDVTHLSFSDQSFDLILAGNVLPFVRSDFLAMSEAHRCLKGEGLAILTAKIQLAKSQRASELHGENPQLFSRAFLAQTGDEWIYGEDFFERIEASGFFFHRLSAGSWLELKELCEQGIPDTQELVLCFKFRDSRERFLREGGLVG